MPYPIIFKIYRWPPAASRPRLGRRTGSADFISSLDFRAHGYELILPVTRALSRCQHAYIIAPYHDMTFSRRQLLRARPQRTLPLARRSFLLVIAVATSAKRALISRWHFSKMIKIISPKVVSHWLRLARPCPPSLPSATASAARRCIARDAPTPGLRARRAEPRQMNVAITTLLASDFDVACAHELRQLSLHARCRRAGWRWLTWIYFDEFRSAPLHILWGPRRVTANTGTRVTCVTGRLPSLRPLLHRL